MKNDANNILQRQFLEGIAKKIGVKVKEDWYFIIFFVKEQGTKTHPFEIFEGTLISVLQEAFPELQLKPWNFLQTPRGFWLDKKNQRLFLEDVAKSLNLQKLESFYRITKTNIEENGGEPLLKIYKDSVADCIIANFPEYQWKAWRFGQLPFHGYWDKMENQRSAFDDIAKELGVKIWSDWYKVDEGELYDFGIQQLIRKYNDSLFQALKSIYPDCPWDAKRFQTSTRLLGDFEQLFRVNEWKNWLQACYVDGKPTETLKVILEYIKKKREAPFGFWTDKRNHRAFLDSIAKDFGITQFEDWYKINREDIVNKGGSTLSQQYGDSIYDLLSKVYPEYKDWKPWKFPKLPRHYWDNEENGRKALESIAKELNIKEIEDWYTVTHTQLDSMGFNGLVDKYGGILGLLQHYFPSHNWDFSQFQKSKNSKGQFGLFKILQEFYGDEIEVFVNHPLDFQGSKLVLDFFVPAKKIAFEFHGVQHYQKHFRFGNPDVQQQKDQEKREICNKIGITLIEIPHWWDKSRKSLEELIANVQNKKD